MGEIVKISFRRGGWATDFDTVSNRATQGRVFFGRVEKRRGGSRRGEELLTGGFRHIPVPQSTPLLRFLFPLIERNVRISRIALSDWLHVRPTAGTVDRGKRSRRMRPSSPYTRSMENLAVPRPWTLCRRVRKSRAR